MILSAVDMGACAVAGPTAAMLPFERMLIEPPLTRQLARGGKLSKAMQRYMDPISLIVGFGLWGRRVVPLAASRKASPPAGRTERADVAPGATSPRVATSPNGSTGIGDGLGSIFPN